MKALVTGANGFLGSHLVERLLNEGAEVTAIVRQGSGIKWLEAATRLGGERFRILRVTGLAITPSEKFVEHLSGATHFFHVAGATSGNGRAALFKANVDTTRVLAEACLTHARGLKRFVFVSSLAAIGPGAVDGKCRDDQTPRPLTWYGESKLEAERVLDSFQTLPWVVVRPPGLYGPRDTEFEAVYQAVRMGVFPVFERDQKLELVHVFDAVEALYRAAVAEFDMKKTRKFLFGAGGSYSPVVLGQSVGQIFGRKPRMILLPRLLVVTLAYLSEIWGRLRGRTTLFNLNKVRELTALNWSIDDTPAREHLGYRPKYTLAQGLRLTLSP